MVRLLRGALRWLSLAAALLLLAVWLLTGSFSIDASNGIDYSIHASDGVVSVYWLPDPQRWWARQPFRGFRANRRWDIAPEHGLGPQDRTWLPLRIVSAPPFALRELRVQLWAVCWVAIVAALGSWYERGDGRRLRIAPTRASAGVKWVALGGSATLAVLTITAYIEPSWVLASLGDGGPLVLSVEGGALNLGVDAGDWPRGLWRSIPSVVSWGRGWLAFLPLWCVTLIAVGVTVRVWFRIGWARQAGACARCGYNLTGNVSGRCPECGHEVSAGARGEPAPKAKRPEYAGPAS